MQSEITKPLLLDVQSITLRVTSEEFEKLCQDNPDRLFELTANGWSAARLTESIQKISK